MLEIVKIHFAGAVITELADGRMFATGVGVGFNNTCFMTRAREVHRAALNGPTRNWNTAELELLKHYSDKEMSKMSDQRSSWRSIISAPYTNTWGTTAWEALTKAEVSTQWLDFILVTNLVRPALMI